MFVCWILWIHVGSNPGGAVVSVGRPPGGVLVLVGL